MEYLGPSKLVRLISLVLVLRHSTRDCTMASFDYNYQNPSLFLFLMLIRAIVI